TRVGISLLEPGRVLDGLAPLETTLAVADLDAAFPLAAHDAGSQVDPAVAGVGDRHAVVPDLGLLGIGPACSEHAAEFLYVIGSRPSLHRIDHHQQVGVELVAIDRPDDRAMGPGSLFFEAANTRLPFGPANESLQRRD